MRMKWLVTTAVALVTGSGAVIAQSQTEQKREDGPRAQQNQPKDIDRPSVTDERAKKDRTAQPEPKGGAREQRRDGEDQDRKQQAKEPRERAPQQSQEQQRSRDGKQPDTRQQGQQGQSKDNQARDTKQPEPKQQQSQPTQPKKDNQARDAKQPAETKQQQGQQQQGEHQPSRQPSDQRQTTDRPSDTSRSASTNVSEQQRSQIVERLRRDRFVARQNINIRVNIGERLQPRVRLQRLPPDIIRIAPQYRGYQYTVVEDRIYVVEPRTRRVIDVIEESSHNRTTSTFERGGGERVLIAREHRETFKQLARRGMTSAPTSASPSLSDQACIQLQPVPEAIVRNNPDLGQYRYLTIGDQVLLVDPREQRVVQVID